jgi:hypothetical protein
MTYNGKKFGLKKGHFLLVIVKLYFLINIRSPLDYNQIRIGAIEFESQKTKNIKIENKSIPLKW